MQITSQEIPAEKEISAQHAELLQGLTAAQKRLPSWLFYDAEGSRLFERIMALDAYYLTRAERNLLQTQAQAICALMAQEPFVLADLGSGNGEKTEILLKELVRQSRTFTYAPLDISSTALVEQTARLADTLPDLDVHPIVSTYLPALAAARQLAAGRPVFTLFLGSNIGNFSHAQAQTFLADLRADCSPRDAFLIGLDLQKDPRTILAAYDDPEGVTRTFNLNMLTRLNREMDADFDLDTFRHYATYDPLIGAARAFLVSTREQTVHLRRYDRQLHFAAWEAIHTESSFKFTWPGIEAMAGHSGFALTKSLEQAEYLYGMALFTPR